MLARIALLLSIATLVNSSPPNPQLILGQCIGRLGVLADGTSLSDPLSLPISERSVALTYEGTEFTIRKCRHLTLVNHCFVTAASYYLSCLSIYHFFFHSGIFFFFIFFCRGVRARCISTCAARGGGKRRSFRAVDKQWPTGDVRKQFTW